MLICGVFGHKSQNSVKSINYSHTSSFLIFLHSVSRSYWRIAQLCMSKLFFFHIVETIFGLGGHSKPGSENSDKNNLSKVGHRSIVVRRPRSYSNFLFWWDALESHVRRDLHQLSGLLEPWHMAKNLLKHARGKGIGFTSNI